MQRRGNNSVYTEEQIRMITATPETGTVTAYIKKLQKLPEFKGKSWKTLMSIRTYHLSKARSGSKKRTYNRKPKIEVFKAEDSVQTSKPTKEWNVVIEGLHLTLPTPTFTVNGIAFALK